MVCSMMIKDRPVLRNGLNRFNSIVDMEKRGVVVPRQILEECMIALREDLLYMTRRMLSYKYSRDKLLSQIGEKLL